MSKKNKILLLLKIPPPYGGGEKRAEWLRDHVKSNSVYSVLEYNSTLQNRANQGFFSFNKIKEGSLLWLRLLWALIVFKPKLVYKNFAHGGFPFIRDSFYVLTCRLFGAKFACELAGEHFHLLNGNRFEKCYAKYTLNSIKSIRVLGITIKNNLKHKGITNCFVMDNGVEVPKNLSLKSLSDGDILKFLFVGLHGPSKGFDALVYAAADLSKRRCNFELHTIGQWISSEFKDEVDDILSQTPFLKKQIFMHGIKHGQKKWDVFNKCHVLILPSLTEGQPLSILEALGFGMFVVATDVGGIPDVIENNINGFLISSKNVIELKEKITAILSNPKIVNKMSQKNIYLFKKRFTKEKYLRGTTKWLKKITDQYH